MSAKSGDTAAGGGGEGEATGNSEGGTTVALQKKRLRRVSFAEMTSVHFFDRDDEYNETPPEESAKEVGNDSEEKTDLLGFRELEDSKGDDEEDRDGEVETDDEELDDLRRSFLRPIESPSLGSAFGSATSNDEDNFFGPVSASFIRPDRLSDSGVSDDNHDVTMDSTAFSMHFRSLARSDLGVDLKTPTGVHLSFEEKTPTHETVGSFMELTVPKKLMSHSLSPVVNKSGSSSSSDMSLVGGSPSSYDYGKLSPRLDALLAEGSKNFNVISNSNSNAASQSHRSLEEKFFLQTENGGDLMDSTDNGKAVSCLPGKSRDANGGFPISPAAPGACDFSSNTSISLDLGILMDKTNSSPNCLSKERTSQSHSDNKLGQTERYVEHESPLVDLISFSPAKQKELLTSSASPLKYMSTGTPQEQRGSFKSKENIELHSASSIQKSISKLKLLEGSPISSSLNARIKNLNIRPSDFPTSSPFNILLEKEINNFQTRHLGASSIGTESQLLSASHQKEEQVHNSRTGNNHIEESVSRGHILRTDEADGAAVSPTQLISSGNKTKHNLINTKDANEKVLLPAEIDLSSAEISLDYIGEKRSTGTPQKFVCFPDKLSQKKLTVSPEIQDQLHDRFVKLQNFYPGRNSASKGGAIDENLSTAERVVHSSSLVVEVSSSNLIEVNATVDGDGIHFNKHGVFENIEKLRTPIREEESELDYTRKLDGNLQGGIGLLRSTSELPGGEPEAASSGSLVPADYRNLEKLTFRKNLVDSFSRNPSNKPFQIIGRDDICMHDVEDVSSPASNQMKSRSFKRRNEVFTLQDREHKLEVVAQQRRPKLQKVGCQDIQMLGYPNENRGETSLVAHGLKHWTDIYLKFSENAESLLAPPIDKLNLSMVDLLEDVLIQWKKSKTYEMLHNEILAQKTSVLYDLRSARVGKTKLLLHKIMHEKAKLLLMRVKRQGLLEKLQLLSSGSQKSQMLKMNCLPRSTKDAQLKITGLQNIIRIKQRDEIACHRVAAMKQALEALDKKNANLIESLHTSCNIKGEPSRADSFMLVNEHLMKRSCYRFIRKDMQMWVIDDVKSRNGHHNIVVNYLNFITQSLKLTIRPASSMVISNKLNDTNILKNFPNMDACKAFSFVLNAGSTQKYLGSRTLAQEMQVTSSLLGNLVDVLQELQLAQIELRNLTETTFHCPLVGQLNLHFCFFSFKSGKKVSLMLDMSCLNRGIYPSEILPLQLTACKGTNDSLVDPAIGEIRDAVKSLKTGYMRILRLCRCISLLVEGLSKSYSSG